MNKVILMGRLTRDVEVRYSGGEFPVAVGKYTLAVNRRFKKEGQQEADFIPCTVFGKSAEFAEKYFKKGQMVSIVGRIQVRSWDDNGTRRWSTDVVVEEQYFTGGKNEPAAGSGKPQASADGFYPVDESVEDDDLPF